MLAFLSLLLFWPVGVVQEGARIDAAKLPRTAASVGEFVPAGWTVEAQVEGDLNKDAIPDLAVTLVEQMPASADKDNPPERQRALLILLKTADGKLSRAALANKVLLCTRCGGAFYGVAETPTHVEISNGTLIVRQEYGSRELTEETYRFRYEPESKRFAFIGVDVKTFDRMLGRGLTESSNFLIGLKVTMKTRLDPQTGKTVNASNTRQRIPQDKKFIEDVASGYN
jgi:hypothetical protein